MQSNTINNKCFAVQDFHKIAIHWVLSKRREKFQVFWFMQLISQNAIAQGKFC